MQVNFVFRGGRLSKWKGKVVSFAPGAVFIAVMAGGGQAEAFESSFQLNTSSSPSLTSAMLSDVVSLYSTAKLEALVVDGLISKSATVGSSELASDVQSNAVTASVISNSASRTLDIGLNNTSGAGSNTVLSAAMQNVGSDAFAAISSSSITNTADITSGSSVGVSNNTMSSSVSLSSGSFILQGSVALGFSNSDDGSFLVNATETGASAGLLIQSTQIASDVQNETEANPSLREGDDGLEANPDYNSSFASVTDSRMTLTIVDTAENDNLNAVVTVERNAISAAFAGNTVTNGINIQSDGQPTLSSTAGISTLQLASNVGIGGAAEAPVSLTSALVDGSSGINVGVAGDVTNVSINVASNMLRASATENASANRLVIDAGVSVNGSSDYADRSTLLTASGATVAAADLFVSNVQRVADSNISTKVDGATGITLAANGSLLGASLASESNTLEAVTRGNVADSTLRVDYANTLSGTVSTTNLQSFTDQSAYNGGENEVLAAATAEVANATLTMSVATGAEATIANSGAELSRNLVSASSGANSLVQLTQIEGNMLSSGQSDLTISDSGSPTTVLTAPVQAVALASGFSSVNLQNVSGDSASTAPVVSARVLGDSSTIVLAAGNGAGETTDSALAIEQNIVSASAVASSSTQRLLVDANQLDASVAMASLQSLTGSILAQNTDTGIALVGAGSVSNVTADVNANVISAGASGNIATNLAGVTAGQLNVVGSSSGDDAASTRQVLSASLQGQNTLAATAAASLLNSQSTLQASDADSNILSSISGATINASLSTGEGAVTNLSMSSDANQITSMARANVATNVLSVNLGSVDMSEAFISIETEEDLAVIDAISGGTNLAALGSVQFNSVAVGSEIDTLGGASMIKAAIAAGTGAVSGTTLSASSNRMTVLASGNSVTNEFELVATNLITTEDAQIAPTLTMTSGAGVDNEFGAITASNAAIAVSNLQANSGSIAASIGASSLSNEISATIMGERDISGSVVAADSNRILAQAVAASGSTNTATIDATNIATSALVGSAQTNSSTGVLTANVGDIAGTVKILASLGESEATATSLSASSNLIGATVTALTDQTTLRLGGTGTALLAGTDLPADSITAQVSATGMTLTADYALAQSQINAGNASATVQSVSIETVANVMTNGAITSEANVLAAQAMGVQGATLLSAQAAVLGSSLAGTSAPTLALGVLQDNSGAIVGTLADSEVSMTLVGEDASVAGTTLSVARNSLAATATGVSGINQLLAESDAGTAGLTLMSDASTVENGLGSGILTADRMILVEQRNSANVTATTDASALSMSVSGAINGSSLAVASNAILGSATGIEGTNLLTNAAGANNSASAALSMSQDGFGTISATVNEPSIAMSTGAAAGSSLMLEANTITATAKGVSATNRLISSGGSIGSVADGLALATTSVALEGDASITGASSALVSQQLQQGSVFATLADGSALGAVPSITMSVAGVVSNTSLSVLGNQLGAVASLADASNVLAELSDTSISHGAGAGGLSLVAVQQADGSASALIEGLEIGLSATSPISGSTLSVDANSAQAVASGLSTNNRTALVAGTSLSGAGGSLASTSDALAVTATASLINSQTLTGNVTAAIAPASDNEVGISLYVAGETSQASALSVASNTLRAQATGVSSANIATVQAGSISDATATLANDQSVAGNVSASLVEPTFALSAQAVTGSVNVSDNRAVASATSATASNTLLVASDSGLGGIATGSVTMKNDADGDFSVTGQPAATLLNRQASSGAVSSNIGNDGGATGSSPMLATLSGVLTGSLAVDNNVLVAQARGNYAEGTLSLSADASIHSGTQAILASNQNRSGDAISASVSGGTGSMLGVSASGATGSLSVDNNVIRASGAANVAINAMTVQTAGFTGSNVTSAAGPGVSAPAVSTTAQFAVLNGQQNTSNVSARVTNYEIGINSTGSMMGSASLNGNMLMADATGNSSITTLRLAAAGTGAIAPMAVVTSQINSGSMSAEVSGASIRATTGSTTGVSGVSGNSITASTTGNLSSAVVAAPGSVFTSF